MYIYIVTLLVKNTENISEFLLYYLVKVVLIQIAHNISALEKNVDKGYYNEKFLSASFEIACQSIFAKWIEHAFTVMKKKNVLASIMLLKRRTNYRSLSNNLMQTKVEVI